MSETCEFTDVEFEIEQKIIGGNSSKTRKLALRDPTFELKAMLKSQETSHFKKIKKPEDDTDDECSDYSERVPAENQPRNNCYLDGNDVCPRRSSRPPERYGHGCSSNLIS